VDGYVVLNCGEKSGMMTYSMSEIVVICMSKFITDCNLMLHFWRRVNH
jgi:hypothetical protein